MRTAPLILAMRGRRIRQSSAALLLTLLVLSLMTIIVVAFLGTMNWEVQASRRSFEDQRARAMVMLGMGTAVGQIRSALNLWDLPFGDNDASNVGTSFNGFNITNSSPPTNYWSVSPGIITIWSYTSLTPVTNYPLFSFPTNTTTPTNVANLNAQAEDGSYPILGASTPLDVYWVNVMASPTNVPSSANPIVGRYAFWVDDENSKIDVNTADGRFNTNMPPAQCGLGWGNPTSVSLSELQDGSGNPISAVAITNIVNEARTVGFNSPREVLQAITNYNLYTNNIFNLTTMSRSPDFNIFGQPKMALVPGNPAGTFYYTNTANLPNAAYNLSTMQPLKELFPSLAGGSPFFAGVTPPFTATVSTLLNTTSGGLMSGTYTAQRYPMFFPQEMPTAPTVFAPGPGDGSGNNAWNNGYLIAKYLSGSNSFGAAIKWPPFPGSTSSATTYQGKYTLRQIDSIAAQIITLAGKDISPDISADGGVYSRTSDYAFPGWLSGKLVNGIGRNPKIDKVLMEFQTQAGIPPVSPSIIGTPPKISSKLFVDLWMPSGFQGVSLFHNSIVYGSYYFGDYLQPYIVNCQDMGQQSSASNTITHVGGTNNLYVTGGALPKDPQNVGAFPPNGSPTNVSYWGNNLLNTVLMTNVPVFGMMVSNLTLITNVFPNGGVDWDGNNPAYLDSDQVSASNYHGYSYQTNGTYAGKYFGTGPPPGGAIAPVFQMEPMVCPRPGLLGNYVSTFDEWPPGQYRCVANNHVFNFFSTITTNAMTTNAAGTNILVYGGMQFLTANDPGRGSEAAAVPLDGMRGAVWETGSAPPIGADANRTGEAFVYSSTATTPSPYTNVLSAVVPINAVVPIPTNNSLSPGPVVYAYDYVQDPLVSKFPSDWIPSVSTNVPNTTLPYTNSNVSSASPTNNWDYSICTFYNENSGTEPTDPESYWLPTIDNVATSNYYNGPSPGPVTPEAPQIPRSARFPSVGYLQYVRTGIMPDQDETSGVPYTQQHGTPFRLFNLNSSSDASQAIHGIQYPDWPMLDLFYVPSSLLSYGSPYESYAGASYATRTNNSYTNSDGSTNASLYQLSVTYSNPNVVNNMYLYGTYGGATCGRINPNGSVVYTTNVNVPTPGIARPVPLQALLHGITINQSITGAQVYGTNDFNAPIYTGGTVVNETNIAQAITNYLVGNANGPGGVYPAPFRMPSEICNVPAIASLYATDNPLKTRNDLVRQIIGNLTTQSNTFSIWVVGEGITKAKGNTGYGQVEAGDQITSTLRYHYIVERDLNPGTDGVYGNALSAGADGIVGTLDDPAQGTLTQGVNPPEPTYVYRVLYAEEIR